jgi:Domain of unknown function (DUF1816)
MPLDALKAGCSNPQSFQLSVYFSIAPIVNKSPLPRVTIMPFESREFWIDILQLFSKAWWIEISTDLPNITYYFGPFITSTAAELSAPGYIKDLQAEAAQGIRVQVKRCQPKKLTIDHEENSEYNSRLATGS